MKPGSIRKRYQHSFCLAVCCPACQRWLVAWLLAHSHYCRSGFRWRTLPGSSPCRGICSCMKKCFCSARRGMKPPMGMRRVRPTASKTRSRLDTDYLEDRRRRRTRWRSRTGQGTDNPGQTNGTTTDSHSACLQMSAVGITENIRGDSKKFEVWYNGREEVYIIQVRNPQWDGSRL